MAPDIDLDPERELELVFVLEEGEIRRGKGHTRLHLCQGPGPQPGGEGGQDVQLTPQVHSSSI